MKLLQVIKSIFVLFVLAALVSCSSSDTSTPNAETGRVSLLITDAPSVAFDQINLTIESISFIPEQDDGAEDEDIATKEVILFDDTRVINLLALKNYSDLLATTTVAVGSYSKIRLHVSQVELVNLNPDGSVAESYIAKLPANGKIDLNPQGSFDVTSGGHLMIELDVDAEKSIHIVETGKGYNFRPVIFVNILGEEELKLTILDGKVLAKTDTGFQLCKVDAVEVNDSCLAVLISENTVVQDETIVVVTADAIDNEDIVTVLGKVGAQNVSALHVVLAAADKSVNNQALFSGDATSVVDLDSNFDMKTDDDNSVVLPDTSLTVTIADGARVFDRFGTVVTQDKIAIGTEVDVFGLAMPDLSAISKVKAAFVIYGDDVESINITGTIADIYGTESKISVTVVDGATTVNKCVAIESAHLLLLKIVNDDIVREEITINDLRIGMLVDVYSDNKDEGLSCMPADVVLVIDLP